MSTFFSSSSFALFVLDLVWTLVWLAGKKIKFSRGAGRYGGGMAQRGAAWTFNFSKKKKCTWDFLTVIQYCTVLQDLGSRDLGSWDLGSWDLGSQDQGGPQGGVPGLLGASSGYLESSRLRFSGFRFFLKKSMCFSIVRVLLVQERPGDPKEPRGNQKKQKKIDQKNSIFVGNKSALFDHRNLSK